MNFLFNEGDAIGLMWSTTKFPVQLARIYPHSCSISYFFIWLLQLVLLEL